MLKHHALTPDEVLRIANHRGPVAKFMTYDKITKLPKPGKAYVVLIRSEPTFGHYVGLLNRGDSVEWYDSYSYRPDRELKWNTHKKNAELGQDAPLVSHLMHKVMDGGGVCEWNEMKFQDEKNKEDVSCGYHVGVRLLYHDMSLDDYQNWLKSEAKRQGTNTSNVVIKIGADILGNSISETRMDGGFFEVSKVMPKAIKKFLEENGEKTITRMMVFRVPIAGAIQKIANWATFGKSKEAFDQLFHLYMAFAFEPGNIHILEKNQRVGVKSGEAARAEMRKAGAEGVAVKNPNMTLNTFMNNAIEKTPESQLWHYSLLENNCQRFTMDMLEANGLMTPALKSFIWQDPQKIAGKNSIQGKIVNKVTDLANRVDNWWKGGGGGGHFYVVSGGSIYAVREINRLE